MKKVFGIPLKFVLAFTIAFILAFFSAALAHAEGDEEIVRKHGISFPIVELGNCGSISECKAFCDSEANRDACMSFAKQKGFYKEPQRDDAILNEAKAELGCDSESSCRVVCEAEENREKCSSFAQKHGLGGPRGKPGDRNILNKAKEILGCDSEESCRAVCENPDNQEKCSNFAKATGLGGGMRRVGPGGCNSEESCKAFCEQNMDECRKFGGGAPAGSDAGRRGPGGCDSEESCRVYCESNPEECGRQGGPGPQDFQERFCRENPDKCSGGRSGPEGFSGPPQSEYEQRSPDQPPAEPIEYPTPSYQTPPTETSGTSGREVRGISTGSGLLQQILDWLKITI